MNKPTVPSAGTPFSNPAKLPGPLSASVAASLLGAVGDVAMVLSRDGNILDISVSNGELLRQGFAEWIGKPLIETVTIESRPKIEEMISDAVNAGSPPRWRQVNHSVEGADIPVRYLTMALGASDRMIAIGRDMLSASVMQQRLLQTQQSLERDYIRLRQAETRYRLLFDSASEAVLIVDAESRCINEANPAAHRMLHAVEGSLIGKPVNSIVAASDRDNLVAHLGAAEASDDLSPLVVSLADRGTEVRIAARLFRQARAPLLLIRLSSDIAAAPEADRSESALGLVIERMPDAFVVVDRDLVILTANAAFIELAELPSVDRAIGSRLGQWLGRPGIDLELIAAQLREFGSVHNVSTILRGSAGAQDGVEVSGVAAPMADSECFGFTIRNVSRRQIMSVDRTIDGPRSIEQLSELVGRMPLKDIVRESTDLIERLCIEAALAYTSDNRASAAEVLGVSRQSLYTKLHRHGLGNLVSDDN